MVEGLQSFLDVRTYVRVLQLAVLTMEFSFSQICFGICTGSNHSDRTDPVSVYVWLHAFSKIVFYVFLGLKGSWAKWIPLFVVPPVFSS